MEEIKDTVETNEINNTDTATEKTEVSGESTENAAETPALPP